MQILKKLKQMHTKMNPLFSILFSINITVKIFVF